MDSDTPATGAPRNTSSSLRRALTILMYLAEDPGHPHGASLAELASGLGLSKSTILRLVAPLRESRLVDQDTETGRYQLGPQNALLGQVYLERLDLRRVVAPQLHQLGTRTGETVHLVAFDPASAEIVYIDKVESAQPVRMHSRIGSRRPAYCTAVGKVFLAHGAEEIVEKVIEWGMPARTDGTITSPQRLRAELGAVRGQGYAVDDIENEPDIRCVAAPVFDHGGTVVTAVSVSGPASRVTRERVAELAALLLESTAEMSRRLGASAHRAASSGPAEVPAVPAAAGTCGVCRGTA